MPTSGEGRTRVWANVERVGKDMVLVLGGGEAPHIGGVVLAVPGEGVQTLVHGPHRDLEVLVPLAGTVSARYGVTVVAVGGVHIDHATPEEIAVVVRNCRALADMI